MGVKFEAINLGKNKSHLIYSGTALDCEEHEYAHRLSFPAISVLALVLRTGEFHRQ